MNSCPPGVVPGVWSALLEGPSLLHAEELSAFYGSNFIAVAIYVTLLNSAQAPCIVKQHATDKRQPDMTYRSMQRTWDPFKSKTARDMKHGAPSSGFDTTPCQ
eukprot:378342-Amphidinium_carterae.1